MMRWMLPLLVVSCARSFLLFPPEEHDGKAFALGEAWGEYADTLDVPPCPPGAELVVNTTTDELDGGSAIADPSQAGPALSLVEALWIAANRPGQDNVYFDEGAFPAAAPGVIRLGSAASFPAVNVSDLCVDARGGGVVVDGDAASYVHLSLGTNAMLVGLEFVSLPVPIVARAGSQIAGCRFAGPGPGLWVDAYGSEIGPANVFGDNGMRVWGSNTWVHDNDFGLDPLTGATLGVSRALDVRDGSAMIIEGNDFGGAACGEPTWCTGIDVLGASGAIIRYNRFGLRALGIDGAPNSRTGVLVQQGGQAVIGPGNLMRGLGEAVRVGSTSSPTVTRNSIFDNDAGIISFDPAPPTIASVTATAISGSCSADGTVELFSDAGAQGETFLGDTACDLGTFAWSGTVPSGRNVTATLTDATGQTSPFSVPVRAF